MDLAVEVYKIIKLLPKEELYNLSDQIRRAAVSIPSNIAEGNQRNTTKDYVNFLYIAKGSNAELKTQLLLCQRLDYLTYDEIKPSVELCDEPGKMLNSLINKLKPSI